MRSGWMTSVTAVDLGTSRLRVWRPGHGPVLDEPSLVALDEREGRACAIGETAKKMIGRIPEGLSVRRAVEAGRVTDFEAARMLAQYALDRAGSSRRARRAVVVTAAPVDCSKMQLRTLEQALLQAGAAQVVVVPAPLAAAVGGALAVADGAEGRSDGLLVDLGAGTVDLAVFANGRMVDASSLPSGGDVLDRAVTAWIRREHQVELGPVAAERLRMDADTEDGTAAASPLKARGRHLGSGANQLVQPTAHEVRQACRPVLSELAGGIRKTLARCPDELRNRIAEHGIVLTGGLARSAWIQDFLGAEVDVPLRVADAPDSRTAEGLALLAESPARTVDFALRA